MRMTRQDRACSVSDCPNAAFARGWCKKHYTRWRVHGDPLFVKVKKSPVGAAVRFLEDKVMAWQSDDCLFWPFTTNGVGYAQIRIASVGRVLVTRLVCERVNGPPPDGEIFALHSCGNGHRGCVSPRHLRWGTRAENAADMIADGRSRRGERAANSKLTLRQAIEIFERANSGENQRLIAKDFGIAQTAVSRIKLGKVWGWATQVPRKERDNAVSP